MSNYIMTQNGPVNADELMHAGFKYIAKEPDGKGGWRYIYYRKEGPKSAKNYVKTSGDKNSKYGIYEHGAQGSKKVVSVYKTNTLLSKTRKFKGSDGTEYENRAVGKLESTYDDIAAGTKKASKKVVKYLKKLRKKRKK